MFRCGVVSDRLLGVGMYHSVCVLCALRFVFIYVVVIICMCYSIHGVGGRRALPAEIAGSYRLIQARTASGKLFV